jgi:hypothetical protein
MLIQRRRGGRRSGGIRLSGMSLVVSRDGKAGKAE